MLDISQIPGSITAHGPGYIDKDHEIIVGLQTEAPLKRADHAERRVAHGARRAEGLRLYAGSATGGGVHQVSEDAQRGRVRRVHRRHPRVPQLACAYGLAGCLRPRPHHRRLPPRGALRCGPADRAQEAGEAGARSRAVHRGDHPRSRGTVGADPGAAGIEGDGRELRVRYLGPGDGPPAKPCSGCTSATSPR